jgi:hypothetical protein
MLIAAFLFVVAVVCRGLSATLMIWNFVPMGAISLYAGARLPRRWAWIVPVSAMIASDIVLDLAMPDRPWLEWTRWTIYATFAATTLLGPLANLPRFGRWILPALPILGSLLFFVTTSIATWADGQLYPRTAAGLVTCFWMALPFLKNTVLSDLIGTALLFGIGPLLERAFDRRGPRKLAEIPIEVDSPDRRRPV